MKYNLCNIKSNLIKRSNEGYVKELKINNVQMESHVLYNNKFHKKICINYDTIYYFMEGKGVFELENDIYYICAHDIIHVNANVNHNIINTGDIHLKYLVLKEINNE